MVVFGGVGENGDYVNTVEKSEDGGASWTTLNNGNVYSPPFLPRKSFGMAALPTGRLVVIGGEDDDGATHNEVWTAMSTDFFQWMQIRPDVSTSTYYSTPA